MKKVWGLILLMGSFGYSLGAESITTAIIKFHHNGTALDGIEITSKKVNPTANGEELKRLDTEIENSKSLIELVEQQTKAEKEMLASMIAFVMRGHKDNKWHNVGGDNGTRCQNDTTYGTCRCVTIVKKAEFEKLKAIQVK